jgi:hypothetical protein
MPTKSEKVDARQGRKKAPTGVDKRAVVVRLMPDERTKLEQFAASAGLTEGAMMRQIFLLGLPLHQASHTNV